jgi:hypothetical protein
MDGMSAFGGASIALGDSSGLRFFDPFLSLIVCLDGDIFRCMDAWMDGIIGRGLVEASGAYLSDYIFLFFMDTSTHHDIYLLIAQKNGLGGSYWLLDLCIRVGVGMVEH